MNSRSCRCPCGVSSRHRARSRGHRERLLQSRSANFPPVAMCRSCLTTSAHGSIIGIAHVLCDLAPENRHRAMFTSNLEPLIEPQLNSRAETVALFTAFLTPRALSMAAVTTRDPGVKKLGKENCGDKIVGQ